MIKNIREPFNAISHLAGAAAAVLGIGLLLAWGGNTPARAVSLVVYGLSLVGLLGASGVYHSVKASPRTTEILRKVDHSAIYLLIAGTYTPFCVIAFSGFWQWGLLMIVWSMALAGIIMKVFIINTPRWLTAGIYVAMGWLSVLAGREFLDQLTVASLAWLLTGGILYTLGAVIYITRKGNFFPGKFGFHELWHVFVLLGAAAHFIAVVLIL